MARVKFMGCPGLKSSYREKGLLPDMVIFKVESSECADLSQMWLSHLKEYPTYFILPIQSYLLLVK